MVKIEIELGIFFFQYYNILLYGDHIGVGPFLSLLLLPPINFCPLLLYLSLSLSLPARLSFYLFLSHLVSGNRIEARQWIVTRYLSCYNPLSCFTPICGVKYDKMKFHEFFCVSNFFFFSPVTPSLFPLSLSPTLSLYLYLSLSPLRSTYISLSRSCPSIFISPIPIVSLSYSHSCLPVYLSLTPVSPSPSPWLSLFLSSSLLTTELVAYYVTVLSPGLHGLYFYYIPMIIYILYYLVFKLVSSFERDSSYHDMYYKGCGLLCAHRKSFNTAIPVRSLGPYICVHYCTYIVHILV